MKKFTEKIIEFKSGTGASEAYIVEPDKSGTLPLLIAIHGNGREALSYRDFPSTHGKETLHLSTDICLQPFQMARMPLELKRL